MTVWLVVFGLLCMIGIVSAFLFSEEIKQWFGKVFPQTKGVFDRIKSYLKNEVFKRRPKPKESKDPLHTEISQKPGWIIFLSLVFIGIFAGLPWIFVWLGIAALYFGYNMHIFKYPDFAVVYCLGDIVGIRRAGPFLGTPHFQHPVLIPQEVRVKYFPLAKMSIGDGTFVLVTVQLMYKILEGKQAILRYLTFVKDKSNEAVEKALMDLCLSHTRTKVGERDYPALSRDQKNIEKDIQKDLKPEFARLGIQLINVQLVEFDDVAHSNAQEIKIAGEAEGYRVKKLAEALDNWKAVAYALGLEWLRGGGRKKTGKSDPKKVDKDVKKMEDAVETVKEKVKEFIEGQGPASQGGEE